MNAPIIKKASELKADPSEEQRWLISNFLPRSSLCLIAAPPKHAKSLICLEVMTSLCSGTKAMGKFEATGKGTCLYWSVEDQESIIKDRLDRFCAAKKIDIEQLALFVAAEQSLLLDTALGQKQLEDQIAEIQPDLCVLDCLRGLHQSNENSATAMNAIFEFLHKLKNKFKCTILVVHHSGKDAGNKLRGSSVLESWYEAGYFARSHGSQMVMDIKFRAHPSVESIPYAIRSEGERLKIEIVEASAEEQEAITESLPETYDINELVRRGELVRLPSGGIFNPGSKANGHRR